MVVALICPAARVVAEVGQLAGAAIGFLTRRAAVVSAAASRTTGIH